MKDRKLRQEVAELMGLLGFYKEVKSDWLGYRTITGVKEVDELKEKLTSAMHELGYVWKGKTTTEEKAKWVKKSTSIFGTDGGNGFFYLPNSNCIVTEKQDSNVGYFDTDSGLLATTKPTKKHKKHNHKKECEYCHKFYKGLRGLGIHKANCKNKF